MATQRPGFTRNDTDIHNEERGETTSYELRDSEKEARSPEITYVSDSPIFDASKEDHFGEVEVLLDAKDVLTHVIHVDDDPTLSPWTFRAFFLGRRSIFVDSIKVD
jgi:hypothetical protein